MTRLWAGQSGVCFPEGAIDFTLLHYNQTSSGDHPSIYSYSTGLKQSELKPVLSPPASAAVKNEWELHLKSPYVLSWIAKGQIYFFTVYEVLY